MSTLESGALTFVVRVWVEGEAGTRVLRGHVTHVQSGKRRHFSEVTEVLAFIAPYVDALGVRTAKPGNGG